MAAPRRKYKPTLDLLARRILSNKRYTKHFLQAVLGLEIDDLDILEGKQIHTTTEEATT